MKKFTIVLVVLVMIFNTSCSTIIKGVNEEIVVNSTPEAANVKYNNQEYRTPAKIFVKRKDQIKFLFKKKGYAEKYVSLERKMNWWTLGNVVLGGFFPVGVVVDLVKGSIYSHKPNPLFVVLDPLPKITPTQIKKSESKENTETSKTETDKQEKL